MSHIAQSPATVAVQRQWRALALPSMLVLVALAYAMHGTFQSLLNLWTVSDSYGHGFIVLGASLYLIYLRRNDISRVSLQSSVNGFFVTCGLIGVWFTSRVLSVLMVEQIAFVLILLALILTLYGTRMAKVVALPILYLFCAVPFWSYLIPSLQDSTAQMATRMSRALGVPIYHDAVYMTIPDGVFLVATTCAGVSYLLAALSLGAFYSLLNLRLAWTRIVLVALAIVGGVVFNWIRVTAIVLIGHHSKMQHPLVGDHVMFGWILFILVVFFVMICGRLLERIEDRVATTNDTAAESTVAASSETSIWAMAIACALLLSLPTYASMRMALPPQQIAGISVPEQLGHASGWRFDSEARADEWSASLLGTDRQAKATFSKAEQAIDVQIGYFALQRQGAEAVNELHKVYDRQSWRRISQKAGLEQVSIAPDLEVNELSIQQKGGSKRRLVWWWYWVDGEFTASRVQAKVLQMRSVFSGNRPAAIVVISSAVVGTVEQTRDEMKAWLRDSAAALAANLGEAPG